MTIIGICVLAIFLSCCVAMLADVDSAIEEALLDDLWDVEDE